MLAVEKTAEKTLKECRRCRDAYMAKAVRVSPKKVEVTWELLFRSHPLSVEERERMTRLKRPEETE